MFKKSNHGISTPIAIGIIAVLVLAVGGGIFAYQYYYLPMAEENTSNKDIDNFNCESITDEGKQFTCFYTRAVVTGDSSKCSILKNNDFRFACYTGVAVGRKSQVECGNINNQDYQIVCRVAVAQAEGGDSICGSIQNKFYQDACYYYTQHQDQPIIIDIGMLGRAINRSDRSICNEIKYKEIRDICYTEVRI